MIDQAGTRTNASATSRRLPEALNVKTDPEDLRRVHAANQRYHTAMADVYDETQPYFSPENRSRVQAILADLRGDRPTARLLDIACGTGFILRLAQGLFSHCVGLDFTPAMLARAPRGPGLGYVMATAESIPFREGSFDAVTAYSILHHMYDLPGMLAETRRVLRPGGWFYADESPNALCTRALHGAAGVEGLDEGLQAEIEAVLADHTRYTARFGLDEDTVRTAMYRKYAYGGLAEDDLRQTLEDVGFTEIRFSYRWVIGGSRLVREFGWERQQAVEAHLRSLLPLTRHLFKYVQVVAG